MSGFTCFGIITFGFALIFFPESRVWTIYLLVAVTLIGLLGLYIFLAFKLATQKKEFWKDWTLSDSNNKLGLPSKG
jgi:hypothetical protein